LTSPRWPGCLKAWRVSGSFAPGPGSANLAPLPHVQLTIARPQRRIHTPRQPQGQPTSIPSQPGPIEYGRIAYGGLPVKNRRFASDESTPYSPMYAACRRPVVENWF
jgi:hypothetical protein